MRLPLKTRPIRRAAVACVCVASVTLPVIAASSSANASSVRTLTYSKSSWLSNHRPRPTSSSPKPVTTTSAAPTTTAAAPTTPVPTTTAPVPTTLAPTTTVAAPTTTVAPAPSTSAVSSLLTGPGIPSSVFGPTNYWHTTVVGAPMDSNSAAMVANLAAQAAAQYGGIAAFNAYRYNVSFFTAGAEVARHDVIWDDCQNKGYVPAGLTGPTGQFGQVPIPDNAVPSVGTDASLTVYSPSLDKVWEFWQAHKALDGWHACWGGRLDNVSTTKQGFFSGGFGSTATGLAAFAGAVTFNDIKAGVINHPLALGIPSAARWDNYSWPAQRSDGDATGTNVIPEGTRFRLNPSINVDALNLAPIAKMIAKAAQTYGFVVTDRAGCVTVVGESGAGIKALTGTDPWDSYLAATPDYLLMKNFPWASLQAMPRNYLMP
jgi:hypothetical protein